MVPLILALGAGDLLAETWPSMPLPKTGWRGPGFYLSWGKMLACWLVFLAWVRSTDWANEDCQELKLDYFRWNPILFGSFVAALVLLWLIPYFWLAFPLMLVAWIAPLTTYVLWRNAQVPNNLRVFTAEHLRFWFSVYLGKMGIKIESQRLDPHRKGPPVHLTARGGPDERTDKANTLAARQSFGLLPAREIIYEGLTHRASSIMLDYTQQGVGLRYLIDGVWLDREAIERDNADPALEAMKIICGLNPQDRQGRQAGTFATEYQSANYQSQLGCQGTKVGERVLLQFEDKRIHFDTMDEIGMRPKMQEQLHGLLYLEKGFVLFSAMPGAGLRTTADVVIHHTDRFTREFIAVEAENKRYEEIENCPVFLYLDGQSPTTVLPKVFRYEPEVIIVRDLVDGETVSMLCREISQNRLILSTIRAKDSLEALMRVLKLGVPPAEFAEGITAVFNQRLVRKLCDACKEAYAPTPQVLKQLGIPEGRVQAFYRPPQQPEEICEACGGIGYLGRTAVFELLTVGDAVRKELAADANPDRLRQAARKDGMRSLQEEGILLVAKGTTSLPELMRVLKQ
ncbi:MAG: hypothetical protein A2V70_19220 [Planctomycetes bacterium RBG_13_63_9]|nr:MAG: hypothetical protein A2V70_19220 [Planctomycetes bacterium RBG_13_63_9]